MAAFSNPLVVLPTYNEAANIGRMISALFGLKVPNLSVLVVDDSSPDGTGEQVRRLQKEFGKLYLLDRQKKEGLGQAYIAGFQEALKRGSDAIIQMDCDFSHHPDDIPRLLKTLENADLVIGSRYCEGGKTENWPISRYLLSKFANIYAKTVTKTPVFDCTSGFKAWRGSALNEISFGTVQTNGYGFQIETTHRAYQKECSIQEIPITFIERRRGESKMSRKIIWEALWMVWKLRFGE